MGTRKYDEQLIAAYRHPKWASGRCAECEWSDKYHKCCDYIFRTGHARSLICPPGDQCTVFSPDTGTVYQRPGILLPGSMPKDDKEHSFSYAQAHSLWSEGRIDKEIGEELGVSKQTIQRWRSLQGLRPNGRGGKIITFREEDARALHAQGLNDHEIGRRLGVSREQIGKWRRRRGLKCNFERAGRKVSGGTAKDNPSSVRCADSFPPGGSTEGCAEKQKRKCGRIREEEARRLYEEGLSDRKIGKALGVSDAAVLFWRRRNGLEPNFKAGRK